MRKKQWYYRFLCFLLHFYAFLGIFYASFLATLPYICINKNKQIEFLINRPIRKATTGSL